MRSYVRGSARGPVDGQHTWEKLSACAPRCVLLTAALWLLFAALSGSARAQNTVRIPVLFHAAQVPAVAELGERFIAEQLAQANEIFSQLGVTLVDAGRRPLASSHAELVTRADRDALLSDLEAGVINCMLVAKLMDVDEPGRERRGVHWHRPEVQAPHLVVVSIIAGPYVLAHELGHFFGHPAHSKVPNNLMSYVRLEPPPVLTEAQRRRMRAVLYRMLKTRELRAR